MQAVRPPDLSLIWCQQAVDSTQQDKLHPNILAATAVHSQLCTTARQHSQDLQRQQSCSKGLHGLPASGPKACPPG